jgi:hypothetical protein
MSDKWLNFNADFSTWLLHAPRTVTSCVFAPPNQKTSEKRLNLNVLVDSALAFKQSPPSNRQLPNTTGVDVASTESASPQGMSPTLYNGTLQLAEQRADGKKLKLL